MPRLVTPDGCVVAIGGHGPLLGAYSGAHYAVRRTVMEPGSYLVMVTDGVPDARHGDEFFGEERLDALLLESIGASAQEMADTIAGTVVEFQDHDPRDDIAVVVVRAPTGSVA